MAGVSRTWSGQRVVGPLLTSATGLGVIVELSSPVWLRPEGREGREVAKGRARR